MNILEWRKIPERRRMAFDVLHQRETQEMLDTLEADHPGRCQHAANDGFAATRALGFIEGYQSALDALRSLAESLPLPPENIPVTWNTEEPQLK